LLCFLASSVVAQGCSSTECVKYMQQRQLLVAKDQEIHFDANISLSDAEKAGSNLAKERENTGIIR